MDTYLSDVAAGAADDDQPIMKGQTIEFFLENRYPVANIGGHCPVMSLP